jgi:hypothetical protein
VTKQLANLRKWQAELKARIAELEAQATGEPSIMFVRQSDGTYLARIQDVEVNIWWIGYEINTWTEEVIDDPCDCESRCREQRDITQCDCPHAVRACIETGNDYFNAVSDPLPSWDEIINLVRSKLRKYYKSYNPAALRFATETWEFAD